MWRPISTAPQDRPFLAHSIEPFRRPFGYYDLHYAVVRWDQGWYIGTELVEIDNFDEWHEIPG